MLEGGRGPAPNPRFVEMTPPFRGPSWTAVIFITKLVLALLCRLQFLLPIEFENAPNLTETGATSQSKCAD